jgi:hypothetical protein
MKAIVILDTELDSTHPMEAVMERRGYIVYRSATIAEAIALCRSSSTPIDLAIVEAPLSGSASQTDASVQIRGSCPEMPILIVSDTPLERWSEEDFNAFRKLLPERIDLLNKPLSQASFIAKVNALLYTVTYAESRKLFEAATIRRSRECVA